MQFDLPQHASQPTSGTHSGFVPTAFAGGSDDAARCSNFLANAEFPEFCERCGWFEHEHASNASARAHIPALLPLRKAS